ncbi:glycine--tRNA ligase subunit beta [Sphingomonas hengshuiensis]|uniref:Glycine--tRNA ligase beta subunit n=1 Tax=Sphingomonas hengshuiensis TaxID=1609977 RepID=A0A7U5HVL1_9SPHN|nr:glycine--tRNA ligase subunit beta [Sphingomonas hengshuiensis]AJP70921.1 glycyl-tRNA synthetase subunit beta [Sphingomonas hengshuiensis]
MTDFLLELRSEEIPARMQEKAREDLARLFAAELTKAGLAAAETVTYATPRRLALIARGLPEVTASVIEDVKGPPADAADAAIDGFLRKLGLTRDVLQTRDVKGRPTLFAVTSKPGRPTAAVLAEAIPSVIRAFPWPKAMRWGAPSLSTESPRWVRPLQGIVALFGSDVVPCEVAGVTSGAATLGHRFHHPGVITIGSADDYVEKLRACHVIVDGAERRGIIALGAKMAAAKAGLTLVEDDGLLFENAGLTEWPMPLLGRFDSAFLEVPPEVIQLTARVNQKYFVCRGAEGTLANAFVCVANIDAADGGERIVEGNQKVLAARLSDARFFYDTDLKIPLDESAKKLSKIVFHEKLGTVADKVDRVAKLARWLVEEGIVKSSPERGGGPRSGGGGAPQAASSAAIPLHHPADGPPPRSGEELAALAERAARLCKADLVTGMVGEFPELQGLMGGYYAAAQGEDPQVAAAIRDHYKPVGQGDEVPTAPVTVAVSLADKLDTIFEFFSIEQMPTGSKDPFALRRAMLGVLALIFDNNLRIGVLKLANAFDPPFNREFVHPANSFVRFAIDRLKVQQREAGVRHDLIDAVFALGGEDDLVRLLARVHALQAFVTTDEGRNLLAGYKRAANILKKESPSPLQGRGQGRGDVPAGESPEETAPLPGPLPASGEREALHPAESALATALDDAEPRAAAAIAAEDFEGAMAALSALRAPIDAFFESVTVNDPDPDKRAARLALLARMRDAVHQVADFTRIDG